MSQRHTRECFLSGGGTGGEGGIRPGRHCGGGGIWRGENMEFRNKAASCKLLFALHTVIFLQPLISPNTPRSFGTTPSTVSALRLNTNQCVHQETYTVDLPDHSPVVKLYRRYILSSYCFTGNRNSVFCTIFTCFQILFQIWKFRMKFGHLVLRKIFKFVATGCQIVGLKCAKFNYGWGSAQTTLGSLLRPRPSSSI